MEEFSGIPIKALLENDEKTTKLDLSDTGCGISEAVAISYCLKVHLYVVLFDGLPSAR